MVLRLLLVLCACYASPVVLAGDMENDFERARTLGERVRNTVFRYEVKPHCLPGDGRFWYRLSTGPQSHEYLLVDAAAGKRVPAFHHARLAASLIEAGEKS